MSLNLSLHVCGPEDSAPMPRVVTKVAACEKVPGRDPELPVNTQVHTEDEQNQKWPLCG